MKTFMPMASSEVKELAQRMVWRGEVPVLSSMESVGTHRLIATQEEISANHFDDILRVLEATSHGSSSIGPIQVAEIDRRLVLVDGHHRASAALRLGWRLVWASVHRLAERSTWPIVKLEGAA